MTTPTKKATPTKKVAQTDNDAPTSPASPEPGAVDQTNDGKVRVRILPLGDGKVHTGNGPREFAKKGAILSVNARTARDLEGQGYAEIQ